MILKGYDIMKKQAVLSAIILVTFLCSCNTNESTASTETVPVTTAETELTSSVTETTTETAPSEEAEALSETEVSSESETTAETAPPEPILPENAVLIDDITYPSDGKTRKVKTYTLLDNDTLCRAVSVNEAESYELYFNSLSDGKEAGYISLDPSFSDIEDKYVLSFQPVDNALCSICLWEHDYFSATTTVVKEAVVYEDYSVEINEVSKPYIYTVGNHKIYEKDGSLFDFDTDKLLVEGTLDIHTFDDGYKDVGKGIRYQSVDFTVDDDSFVYRTGGYEWTFGFGYYDYRTGENKFFDLYDHYTLGMYDGKILSIEAYDYCFMPTIYSTDPQTAETEIFMEEADFPTDHMMLSQDENYIASFCSNSNSSNDKLILVDLNEKGNFSEYDIFVPQSGGFCFMSEMIIFSLM